MGGAAAEPDRRGLTGRPGPGEDRGPGALSRAGPPPRRERPRTYLRTFPRSPTGRGAAGQCGRVTNSFTVLMLWSIIGSVRPGKTPIQKVRSVVMSLLVSGPLTLNSRPS